MIHRIKYYMTSVLTLLRQVENWYMLPLLVVRKRPMIINLRTGYKFKVRSLMDAWIIKETCLDRDYESNSVLIEDGWVVVDIGAGIGEFAILVGKEHPSCQVYAFEPFPESFDLLQENLRLNMVDNIVAFQLAVGSKSGKMLLATTGEAVQHTTTRCVTLGGTTVIEVQGLSLDELFQSNGIERCDFLKMDCEGCEFEVLLNSSPMALERINHICLEYHDGFTEFSHVDLVNHLQRHGFRVKIMANPVHNYLGFLYACR
ncbi:MAG: FkbM family methyltransferase [Chloroflexi bacterium]|nr:MAG: FkbM family methyltransferase [Chloroflexota bacterium]